MKNAIKVGITTCLVLAISAFTAPIEKVEVKSSSVTWVGKKVTGQHNGTIDLKSGYFNMEGDQIIGGEFVIDMTSITVSDLKAGSGKEKLEGHLKSDDFFGVANHPTSKLVISSALKNGNTYTLSGDLTIKNITNPITFEMTMKGNEAKANVVIDRSKFDVRYGSGSFFDNLGDKTIYDDFELTVNLTL